MQCHWINIRIPHRRVRLSQSYKIPKWFAKAFAKARDMAKLSFWVYVTKKHLINKGNCIKIHWEQIPWCVLWTWRRRIALGGAHERTLLSEGAFAFLCTSVSTVPAFNTFPKDRLTNTRYFSLCLSSLTITHTLVRWARHMSLKTAKAFVWTWVNTLRTLLPLPQRWIGRDGNLRCGPDSPVRFHVAASWLLTLLVACSVKKNTEHF